MQRFLTLITGLVGLVALFLCHDADLTLAAAAISMEEVSPDGKLYPMKFQPEYEDFAMARYFRTRELVRFQIRCFFYGGPCDIVGRWAKPRIKTGFLGPCIKCTEKQENWLADSLNLIAESDPDLFRAVIARYIEFYGITLPFEDRLRVAKAFEM